MGKLDGKVCVVTGASRGIGQEIAELFAAEGGKVVCAARTVNEGDHKLLTGSLAGTVKNIKDAGGEATPIAVNLLQEEECERLIDEAEKIYGPVDVLVNNAALNYYVPYVDYPTKNWIRSYQIDLFAPFILSKRVLKGLINDKRAGAVVNIGSGAAIGPGRGPYEDQTVRGGVMYGSVKAALERMTQGVAQEMSSHGNIAVTCLSPSQVVPTPGTVYFKLVEGMDDPKGEPVDYMAKATLLLASEPAEKVNGRVTYSQEILKEFGWIEKARGRGVDIKGSGYSQI